MNGEINVPTVPTIPEIVTTPPPEEDEEEPVNVECGGNNGDTLKSKQRSRGSSFVELDSIGAEGKRVPSLEGKVRILFCIQWNLSIKTLWDHNSSPYYKGFLHLEVI